MQQRQYFYFLQQYRKATIMQTNSILQLFNNFTFATAAQSVLSSLDQEDLHNLLAAIQNTQQYRPLTQLVSSRILVGIAETVDRSYYFTHYDSVDQISLREERANMVATRVHSLQLKTILDEYRRVIARGSVMFGQDYQEIRSAVFEPDLQLPPFRRETVAPSCQTVYQIVLAIQKLNFNGQEQSLLPQNQKTTSFFFDCLQLQIEIANIYLSSLRDDYEFFAEITYRFMLYRNTVLTLHSLSPFPALSQTMALWNSFMHSHYVRSHRLLGTILCRPGQEDSNGHALLSGQQLRQQGYLQDYIQGVVDLSVDENTVAFCGHSKQRFGGEYAQLEKQLFNRLAKEISSLKQKPTGQQVFGRLKQWRQCGVKPSTLLKICDGWKQLGDSQKMRESVCCRQDAFIETCARINGLSLPDSSNLHLWCC